MLYKAFGWCFCVKTLGIGRNLCRCTSKIADAVSYKSEDMTINRCSLSLYEDGQRSFGITINFKFEFNRFKTVTLVFRQKIVCY